MDAILGIIIKDIATFKKNCKHRKIIADRFVWSINDRPILTTWSIGDRFLSLIEFDKFYYICNLKCCSQTNMV